MINCSINLDKKENFNFHELGSLVGMYQRLADNQINLVETDLKLKRFDSLIKMLVEKRTYKNYKTKKKKF